MESRTTQLPKDQLPQPRKLPVQTRSKALVDAIAEACLRILDKEGEEALTVNRIAEVSGATVGSIYQYFPNKESMIAAVYERLLDQESVQLYQMREQLQQMQRAYEQRIAALEGRLAQAETKAVKAERTATDASATSRCAA